VPASPLACPPAPPELPMSPPPAEPAPADQHSLPNNSLQPADPRQLTSPRSPATRYRRLQTRHRRLPNHHRLSRRLLCLGRPQFRLPLRGFITNTTGISATSAENTIIKSHIFIAGFAMTNKIFLSVYGPQQGGAVCIVSPCFYVCLYEKK
jgi:hypothetical protein